MRMASDEVKESGAGPALPTLTERQLMLLNAFLQNLGPAATQGMDWERLATQLDYKTARSCRECFRSTFRKHGWFQAAAGTGTGTGTDAAAAAGPGPATPASVKKVRAVKKNIKAESTGGDGDGAAVGVGALSISTPKTPKQKKSTSVSPKKRSTPAGDASVLGEHANKKGKLIHTKDAAGDGNIKEEDGVRRDDGAKGEDSDEV